MFFYRAGYKISANCKRHYQRQKRFFMKKIGLLILFGVSIFVIAFTDVGLPAIIGNHMVLQQNSDIKSGSGRILLKKNHFILKLKRTVQ